MPNAIKMLGVICLGVVVVLVILLVLVAFGLGVWLGGSLLYAVVGWWCIPIIIGGVAFVVLVCIGIDVMKYE